MSEEYGEEYGCETCRYNTDPELECINKGCIHAFPPGTILKNFYKPKVDCTVCRTIKFELKEGVISNMYGKDVNYCPYCGNPIEI